MRCVALLEHVVEHVHSDESVTCVESATRLECQRRPDIVCGTPVHRHGAALRPPTHTEIHPTGRLRR